MFAHESRLGLGRVELGILIPAIAANAYSKSIPSMIYITMLASDE